MAMMGIKSAKPNAGARLERRCLSGLIHKSNFQERTQTILSHHYFLSIPNRTESQGWKLQATRQHILRKSDRWY